MFCVQQSNPPHVEVSLWWLTTNAVKEVITGLIIGYSLNLIFYGINFAGDLIGFNMELNISQVLNPLDSSQTNVIGQALILGALMIFILINGHQFLIKGLAYSFKIIPLGKFVVNESVYQLLIKYSAAVFVIAIKIASPILISFFLINIAEGIIARVIPQIQVFFMVQPLTLAIGFFLLVITAPIMIIVIRNLLQSFEGSLTELLKAFSM